MKDIENLVDQYIEVNSKDEHLEIVAACEALGIVIYKEEPSRYPIGLQIGIDSYSGEYYKEHPHIKFDDTPELNTLFDL